MSRVMRNILGYNRMSILHTEFIKVVTYRYNRPRRGSGAIDGEAGELVKKKKGIKRGYKVRMCSLVADRPV